MPIELMKYWSISSVGLTKEALKMGLEVEIISKNKNLFYVRGNGKEVLFKSSDFGGNSSLGLKIANDKELTYKILENKSVPIAKTWYIEKKEIEILENLKIEFPVIIKPIDEGHGDGVMMNILNIEELKEKLNKSFSLYTKMIIQKQIEGDEHRIIVLKGKVIAAITRIPPQVVGDGINTIEELINIENKTNKLRGEGNEKLLSYIKIDNEMISFIKKKGYNVSNILEKDLHLKLRGNSNLSSGGTFIDIFDKISNDIKEISIKSAKSLKLDIAGIDIITTDYTKKLSETNGIILEINSTPGVNSNMARDIIKELFFNK